MLDMWLSVNRTILSSRILFIVTILFILKLEHTGFQKALLYIINAFNSIKKLEITQYSILTHIYGI